MRNLALLTDFYELTMMNCYLHQGKQNEIATFDLFFRPFEESNFCITAGLENAIDYIQNINFGTEEIEYLRSTNSFDEEFLQWLADYKFSGSIRALPEGTVVFPNEPIMIVTAPIMEAQLLESALLNIVNFETLIATKARRVCDTAYPAGVLEFGLRRAQSIDAAVYGARASVIGGAVSTSNVLCAKQYSLPPKGTHAHSWVMSFDNEYDAFVAYADSYPDNCLLLVDTYDTLKSGVPNAIRAFDYLTAKGHKPVGIRLDSGDLAYLSKQARIMLDNAGYTDAVIFASSDIDEYVLTALNEQGACIDMYGVGTKMITSHNNASLGGVYKISNININGVDHPKMKISDNAIKITNPASKSLYRLIDNNTNKAIADLITLEHEIVDGETITITHPTERYKSMTVSNYTAMPLLVDVFVNGELVYNCPSVLQCQKNCRDSLNMFWEEYKRITKPHCYKVDLSEKLYELKSSILLQKRGNNDKV